MSLINIGGSDDPAYRYKMPRVMNKIEGRGNGIKTVVPNMSAVAAALNRPAALPTKYLGVELGAQSRYDKASDRAVVNGAFPPDVLQEHINSFVDKFVLCPKCHLPETELVIKTKSQTIMHKCAACGAKESVDMTHKLCTFILKDAGGNKKKEKKDKKKERKKDKAGGEEEEKKEKKKKEKKEKKDKKERKRKERELAAAAAEGGESSSDEDGPRAGAGSAAAAPAPASSAGASAADIAAAEGEGADSEEDPEADGPVARLDAMVVDDTSAVESAVASLRTFIAENPEDANGIYQKTRELQTNSALQMEDRVKLYYLAAFGNRVLEQTKTTMILSPLATIIASVSGDRTKTDLFEATLLDCIEEHLTTRTPDLMPVAPLIIKNLYDVSILEEESIGAWWDRPTTMHSVEAAIRSRVRPFVEWLRSAETESESEDESDPKTAKEGEEDEIDSGEESDLLAEGEEEEVGADEEMA